MKIAICDDETVQRKLLVKLLDKWAQKSKAFCSIETYESAEEFLFAYADDKSFDILLLDIQMEDMDGIALAKEIRKDNRLLQIIFITGFIDYIAEGYDVSALHYLVKPVNEQKLFTVLDKAIINLNHIDKSLLITADGENTRIPINEIMVCESFAHTTAITTKTITYETRLSITEVEKQLDDSFIRCHRSYLVGIRHIGRITKTDVILDNSMSVPLSRRSYNDVNQAFIRYFKGVQ